MLLRHAELDAIRTGEIDLAFRRWERPRLRAGTKMGTAIGLVEAFKRDVRKLKELGLTESLERGYRLSPRGEAVLHHTPT